MDLKCCRLLNTCISYLCCFGHFAPVCIKCFYILQDVFLCRFPARGGVVLSVILCLHIGHNSYLQEIVQSYFTVVMGPKMSQQDKQNYGISKLQLYSSYFTLKCEQIPKGYKLTLEKLCSPLCSLSNSTPTLHLIFSFKSAKRKWRDEEGIKSGTLFLLA